MNWIFYFLLLLLAAISGYSVGRFLERQWWLDNYPTKTWKGDRNGYK